MDTRKKKKKHKRERNRIEELSRGDEFDNLLEASRMKWFMYVFTISQIRVHNFLRFKKYLMMCRGIHLMNVILWLENYYNSNDMTDWCNIGGTSSLARFF